MGVGSSLGPESWPKKKKKAFAAVFLILGTQVVYRFGVRAPDCAPEFAPDWVLDCVALTGLLAFCGLCLDQIEVLN